MSGRTRSYSCLTSIAGRDSLPVFPLTISVRRASCGAIPSTTGTPCGQRVTVGRLTECEPCSLTWMRFAWITSAASRPHGMFQQAHQRPSPDNGYQGRAPIFLKQYETNWATCNSSSKIWELLLRMCRHCATNFNCLVPGFCSSPLTVIQITHTYRTTLSRTQLLIPGPMTMLQLENGTKNCLITSDRTFGLTSSARPATDLKLLRH